MDKYRNTIFNEISHLTDKKKIIFCLLICEKLLPNYDFFFSKFNYGDPLSLQQIIAKLYENLFKNIDDKNIGSYIASIESITPNTENFNTILVSFALDACTSILSTLFFILDKDIENIIDVATYARDTVDMYIQEKDNLSSNNKDLEILIEQDTFMQDEKNRQLNVIKYLNNSESIGIDDLENLRNIGRKNIIDLNLLYS
jgi:uncharacterized protein YjaG (DUF416 family)